MPRMPPPPLRESLIDHAVPGQLVHPSWARWFQQWPLAVADAVVTGPTLDATRFGAKGDGVTDDTAALQAALDATVAAHGVLVLPPGVYPIHQGLVASGTTDWAVRGAGQNRTRLLVAADGVTALAITGVSSRIHVSGLWIGSAVARSSGGGLAITGTVSTYADHIVLEDIQLQNLPTPLRAHYVAELRVNQLGYLQSVPHGTVADVIVLRGCVSARCHDVVVSSVVGTLPGHAVVVEGDCDTILWDGLEIWVTGASTVGLLFRQGGGATGPRIQKVSQASIEGCGLAGVRVEAGRDISLSSVSVANNGVGIQVAGASGVMVRGCTALSNATAGVEVSSGDAISVQETIASNNASVGIAVQTSGVRLVGNRCGTVLLAAPSQPIGCQTAASTDYLVLVANDFRGNHVANLVHGSLGTHNQLVGNVV